MKNIENVVEYFDRLEQWKEEAILLREIVISCSLTETLKWGAPCYTLDGKNVVGIGVFKAYVGLWFFQGVLLKDPDNVFIKAQEKTQAMLQWRFKNIDEIQNGPVREYILESIELFKQGKKIKSPRNVEIVVPDLLLQSLSNDSNLKVAWNALSPGCKREYINHILEAKREETRKSRIDKIKPMILEGKGFNDKYKK